MSRGVTELLRDGFRCNRSTQLWCEFLEFHRQNLWVYDRLKELVAQLRANGHSHYSTRTLISVLRFEWDLTTHGEDVIVDGGDTIHVKLNNNHSPYYARMMIEEMPHLWEFFELRHCDGDPEDPEARPAHPPVQWTGQGLLFR